MDGWMDNRVERGEKPIKTVNGHFGFPWQHLIITSHEQFTGEVRRAGRGARHRALWLQRETLPCLP